MVRDVNEPYVVKQTEDPVFSRIAAYESETWGSAGGYATGGVEALVSTLARVAAARGPGLNSSGGRWQPKIVSVSSNAVKVILFGTTGGSGDAMTEAATGTATSGVMQVSFIAFGE